MRALGLRQRGLPPCIRLSIRRREQFPSRRSEKVDADGQIRLSPDRIYCPLAGLYLCRRWQSRLQGGVLGMHL